jgi:hypothetical protein
MRRSNRQRERFSSNNEDAEDLASSIWAELYGLRQDATATRKASWRIIRDAVFGWAGCERVVSQLAVDQYRKQSKIVQIEETREFENLAEESSNHTGNEPRGSSRPKPGGIIQRTADCQMTFRLPYVARRNRFARSGR